MSLPSLVRVFMIGCVVSVALSTFDVRAQTPAPGTPAVDAETAKQIRELKLQAIDAQNAGDLNKELDLQMKILRLDPDDARALIRNEEIRKVLADRKKGDREGELDYLEDAAKDKLAKEAILKAQEALIEAKRTHGAEPLERAQTAVDTARKYARPDDVSIARLEVQIQQERDAQQIRRWQLWGFVGLVAVALTVGLVLYFRRGGRVLETVDGPQMGQVFVLEKPTTTVGALASEVDWAIDDPLRKISRHHCDVIREGRRYFLVDCSMNGTYLNGRPLQKGEPALLRRGDRIGLGGAVTLRFR